MSALYTSIRDACRSVADGRLANSAAPELVRDALDAELPSVLRHMVVRTYVTELHRFREQLGLPADANSTRASDAFHAQLDGDAVASWFHRYPVLKRLLTTVVEHRVAELDRVAGAIEQELEGGALVRAGILPAGHGGVERIRSLGSDLHNGSRVVCAVKLTSGESVVYKPRPLGVERVAARVFAEVADASGVDVTRCVPRSLDRGDFGWQEFVRPAPLAGPPDAGTYFRRLGVVAAVAGIVGAIDMHHENIVAAGETPVLVDLETFMHPEQAVAEVNISSGLAAAMARSIVSTMLLPQRVPFGPYSVLMGGMGVPDEQLSERADFVVVDAGTDAVDIARRQFRYRHTDNIPVDAGGTRYSAIDCADELMDGLERGYAACRAREARLLEIVDEPVPVRHILRSSAIYHRILSAATHPDHLGSEHEFRRILSLLGSPSGWEAKAQSAFATAEEADALAGGDLPYFTVCSDDIRLRGRNETSPAVFDVSPRGRAAAGLAAARTHGSRLSRYLVEVGLDELGAAVGRPPRLSEHTFGSILTSDGARWRTIVERLKSLAVRAPAPGGDHVGWLSAGYGADMATFDVGPFVSLHDGGGIEILFARIDECVPDDADPEFTAAVRRGVDWLGLRFREVLDENVASVVSGPASLAYVRSAGEAIEALCERALDAEAPGDMLAGFPGYGVLVPGHADAPADLLARLLARTEDALAAGALTRSRWNLAHGELGLVWALHRLASRLDDAERIAHAAERYEAILAAATDPPSGWCNGTGGLAMVGAEILPDNDRLRDLADRMTGGLGEDPVDISVCHGLAGRLQTLVHVARCLDERWPLELAAEHLLQAGAVAERTGTITGVADRTNLPGYFLGWSGFADSVLVLELERDGRSPWLPLAFAPGAKVAVA